MRGCGQCSSAQCPALPYRTRKTTVTFTLLVLETATSQVPTLPGFHTFWLPEHTDSTRPKSLCSYPQATSLALSLGPSQPREGSLLPQSPFLLSEMHLAAPTRSSGLPGSVVEHNPTKEMGKERIRISNQDSGLIL